MVDIDAAAGITSQVKEDSMITRRQFLNIAAGMLVVAASPARAAATDYPAQPIRLLVGFAAGGNFDLVARILAQSMSEHWRQPIVVENRPGAGGNIATEAMIRAPADGYTLLLCGAANAVNASLYEKLPFTFIDDVAPIAGVVRFPNVLAVNSSLPVTSLSEFIGYTRANAGKVNQGSSGTGTTQHLAGELFKLSTGADFTHVPYKGASQAINDLIGGQVQVVFEPLPASLPFIKAGKMRALAVTTSARSEALPDVPTIGESFAGYEASGWTGLCAPRGTPAQILETLNGAVNAALADAAIRKRYADLGATPMPGSRADFANFFASEIGKWSKVIRAGNIKPS